MNTPQASHLRRPSSCRAWSTGLIVGLALWGWPAPCAGQGAAPSGGDFACSPVRADEFRVLFEAVDQARRTQDPGQIRTRVVQLAERLLEGTPDGGLPVSGERWVGPGTSLEELLALLDAGLRQRIEQDLEVILNSRLGGTAGISQQPLETLERWARDFPGTTMGQAARERLASLFVENGQLEAALALDGRSWSPAFRQALHNALSAHSAAADAPAGAARAMRVVATFTETARIDEESPFAAHFIRRVPRVTPQGLVIQDVDAVRCLDPETGAAHWVTPFPLDLSHPAGAPPVPLPGTELAPALLGGRVVACNSHLAMGLDVTTGAIHWELSLAELFPAPAEPETPDSSTPAVLAVSPPLAVPGAVALAVQCVRRGTLELRLVLVDSEGTVLWNRQVATANGATYLALGSARPSLAVRGRQLYLLSQRGLLFSHHLSDGSLVWAVRYASYPEEGSRDALRYGDRFEWPPLEVRGRWVCGAPLDSAFVTVWDAATGAEQLRVPRHSARWVSWADPASGLLLLAAPEGGQVWQLQDTSLIARGSFSCAPHQGLISGPPTWAQTRWLAPHEGGFHAVDTHGEVRTQILRAGFPVRGILALPGGRLYVEGARLGALLGPEIPAGESLAPGLATGFTTGLEASLQRIRALAAAGESSALLEALAALPDGAPGSSLAGHPGAGSTAQALLAMARSGALELDDDQHLALAERVLDLLPRDGAFAQIAYDQAVTAARRGTRRAAARFAYGALEAPENSSVRVQSHLVVTVELAVRRLLQRLAETYGQIPGADITEQSARVALERARIGDDLGAYRATARSFPGTAASRQALLQVSRKYARQGSNDLALTTLESLALYEPGTDEALEARLRSVELLAATGRPTQAHAVLQELLHQHADHRLAGVTVAERVARLNDRLPRIAAEAAPLETAWSNSTNLALPLVPVWRSATDMHQQRRVHAIPLPPERTSGLDPGLLIIAERSVELRSVRSGHRHWVTRFRRPDPDPRRYLLRRGFLEPPLGWTDNGVIIGDSETVRCLDLDTGSIRWEFTLPPLPGDPGGPDLPASIEFQGCGAGILLASGAEARLHGVDLATGRVAWVRDLATHPWGEPSFQDQQFVVTFQDPPRLEIQAGDGAVLRTIEIGPLVGAGQAVEFSQSPWFVEEDHILVPLTSGLLIQVQASTGKELWRQELPAALEKIHDLDNLPFLVAELTWGRQHPTLVGLSPSTGAILWKKDFRAPRDRLQGLAYHAGDLYLLEGDFNRPKLIRLELPPVFLDPQRWAELPAPEPLPTLWTAPLRRGWDQPSLRFDRDFILCCYPNQCEIAVLTRDTPSLVHAERFAAVERFLLGRKALYFADTIGDTLVVVTARGSAGFRSPSPWETLRREWRLLLELDPLQPDALVSADEAAALAFQAADPGRAMRVLEEAIERPGSLPRERRTLLERLAGFAQAFAEDQPRTVSAPYLHTPPTIDGLLGEDWNARTAVAVRAPRFMHPLQGLREDAAHWTGWRDLSALVLMGWSDEGFHLALDVTDDSVQPYDREASTWRGDCLLIAIDYENDGGMSPRSNDQLLTLALTVPRPPGAPPGADGEGDEPPEDDRDEPAGNYQVQRKKDGSGVVYEMTIPWESFRKNRRLGPPAPFLGLEFRLNLVLTDDDTGRGSESYLSLSPGQALREESDSVWDVFIPSHFPLVRLTE